MRFISGLRLEATNFRSFSSSLTIEKIKPINVIIGRNNSGKSAFVDLLNCFLQPPQDTSGVFDQSGTRAGPGTQKLTISFKFHLTSDLISRFLSDPYPEQPDLNEKLRSSAGNILFTFQREQGRPVVHTGYEGDSRYFHDYFRQFAIPVILQRIIGVHRLFRIRAERDILAESPSTDHLQSDGKFATAMLTRHLTHEGMDRNLVRKTLFEDLNGILRPDCSFDEIIPKQRSHGPWEIYFRDAKDREIAISEMGSGVKTVLLVLIAMRVLPAISYSKTNWVFALEELENNLHPAMLRRLINYILVRNEELKSTLVLTTHSPVMVDILARRNDTQVLHVKYDGNSSTIKPHEAGAIDRTLLEDIGARPSDLLLTNAVIWVEGPSDRIYVRHWIDLWSDGKLQEGMHYQFVMYGGSAVAHYSFDSQEQEGVETEALIQAIKINHNAVVIMDSDKKKASDSLKGAVQRIQEEAQKSGALAWVTIGNEVENYIPDEASSEAFGGLPAIPTSLDDYFNYLATNGKGISWSKRKVELAKKICPHIKKGQLEKTLDLPARLDEVCAKIRLWNGIES